MPSYAQQQQQQQQQQQIGKPGQPSPADGKVLSDSTLVVIVCSIFASLVGVIFIACLLRAVCRDLPTRCRAWRRRRRGKGDDSNGNNKESRHGNHHHQHAVAEVGKDAADGDYEPDNCDVGKPPATPPRKATTTDDPEEFGVMLMHRRQDSVEVIDTVGQGSGDCGGLGCVTGSSRGDGGDCSRWHQRRHQKSASSAGPHGRPIDKEYFV